MSEIIRISIEELLEAELDFVYTGSWAKIANVLWENLRGTGVTQADCNEWAYLHTGRLGSRRIIPDGITPPNNARVVLTLFDKPTPTYKEMLQWLGL